MSELPPWGIADSERYCIQKLDELRRKYECEMKPYLDLLHKIEAMKPPRPLIITKQQWEEAQGGKSDG